MQTIGSLFAGIGGFDLGFERAGFRTVFVCEIDKSAQTVLRHRFPAAQLFKDVRAVGAHNLPKIDVLTFGSPCQDLSVAGKRAGLAGERSGLFHEATRIIRELRERDGTPDLVVWENVPGAFSSNNGRDFEAVVQAMVDLGARDICWRILDSQHFGVAQRRRRVFLVADFAGERAEAILFEPEGVCGNPPARRASRQEAAGGFGEGAKGGSREWPAKLSSTLNTAFGAKMGLEDQHALAGASMFVPVAVPLQEVGKRTGISTTDVRAGIGIGQHGDPMFTLQATAQHGVAVGFDATGSTTAQNGATEDGTGRGVPIVAATSEGRAGAFISTPTAVRRLTPVECERLQGFPDGWTSEGVDEAGRLKSQADGPRYKQLGNAVTVNVAEWIARRMKRAMDGEKS